MRAGVVGHRSQDRIASHQELAGPGEILVDARGRRKAELAPLSNQRAGKQGNEDVLSQPQRAMEEFRHPSPRHAERRQPSRTQVGRTEDRIEVGNVQNLRERRRRKLQHGTDHRVGIRARFFERFELGRRIAKHTPQNLGLVLRPIEVRTKVRTARIEIEAMLLDMLAEVCRSAQHNGVAARPERVPQCQHGVHVSAASERSENDFQAAILAEPATHTGPVWRCCCIRVQPTSAGSCG